MTARSLSGCWFSCVFCPGGDTDLCGLVTQIRGNAQKGAEPGLGAEDVSGQKVKPAPVLLPSMESRISGQEDDAILLVTGMKNF